MNVSAPVRFRDDPVELSKFNDVTVLDPALKAPVRFRFEPVALVQIMRFTVVSCDTFKLVPVAALKVKVLDRFKAEPVAVLKFSVVTVDDPALKAPVRLRFDPEAELNDTRFKVLRPVMFSFEPVAALKFSVVTVDDPALNAPVRFRFEPVAELNETVFRTEPAETARLAEDNVPAANTEPLV
jgi:hypothetical protein